MDASIWATSPLRVVIRHILCVWVCVCVCVCMCFLSQLCCPLRFQNSSQTYWWEGFLMFGNFSFMAPSQGWVFIPNSSFFLVFIFCPTSFQRKGAAFLGAWCPPPALRCCFVEVAQHSNDLLMNLWGRKWSPSYSSVIFEPHPPPNFSFKIKLSICYKEIETHFSILAWEIPWTEEPGGL